MPRTGRKPGRPSGRKPLLNLRVPAPLLSHIKRTARKNGLTITEEATRRLQQSLDRSDADFAEIVAGVVMPALREAIERSDCWAAIAMKNQKLLMTKLQQTDAAAGNPLGAPPMRETTRPPHDSAEAEITHTAPPLAAAIELAYGLLWHVAIDRRDPDLAYVSLARRTLLEQLDRDGQRRGIEAARRKTD